MKYTILINQKVWADKVKNLDIIDLSIFDYLITFSNSRKCSKISDAGKDYFWFAWKKISDDMPLLNLNTRQAVFNRTEKLVNAGLLKRHKDNKAMQKSYYHFTDLAYEYYDDAVNNGVQACKQPFTATCTDLFTPPVNNGVHNTTISNTTIIDETINSFADSKKSAKNDEDYKISVEAYFTFYEKKSGLKPKFDGVDGKALKAILKFLQKISDEGGNVHTKAELLKIIFDNWTKIEPWLQERFTIRDINTNLNKILTNLKNGKANATDRSKADLTNYAQELTGKRY